MTKTFEEELKDREAETFSHWDGCTISKKEFINYADVVNLSQGWVSPEEYEKLVKDCAVYVLECKNINRVNAQLTKENEDLKSQLQQRALPVVPECVAEFIEFAKTEHLNLFNRFDVVMTDEKVSAWLSDSKAYDSGERRDEILARAWLDGYTVEKPQLFYIELPNVYGLKNKIFVSKVENGTIVEFSNGKDYALKLTEQEIKSIDERYWQFAVPVEDGE